MRQTSSSIVNLGNNEACPVRPPWFYTYVLLSRKDNMLYTGVTWNLKNRIQQHNEGKVFSTRHRVPLKLIYFEACLNKSDAYRREKYLKTGMGKRYLRNRLHGGLTGEPDSNVRQ